MLSKQLPFRSVGKNGVFCVHLFRFEIRPKGLIQAFNERKIFVVIIEHVGSVVACVIECAGTVMTKEIAKIVGIAGQALVGRTGALFCGNFASYLGNALTVTTAALSLS